MFFYLYATLFVMVNYYRVFLAVVAAATLVYLFLRFKMKDDVALGKALLVFFALMGVWTAGIAIFILPTAKM